MAEPYKRNRVTASYKPRPRKGFSSRPCAIHPLLKPEEACRICVVEVEGEEKLVASCAALVKEGMVIETDSQAVLEARRGILEASSGKSLWGLPGPLPSGLSGRD